MLWGQRGGTPKLGRQRGKVKEEKKNEPKSGRLRSVGGKREWERD